jgi:hypothetical protein
MARPGPERVYLVSDGPSGTGTGSLEPAPVGRWLRLPVPVFAGEQASLFVLARPRGAHGGVDLLVEKRFNGAAQESAGLEGAAQAALPVAGLPASVMRYHGVREGKEGEGGGPATASQGSAVPVGSRTASAIANEPAPGPFFMDLAGGGSLNWYLKAAATEAAKKAGKEATAFGTFRLPPADARYIGRQVLQALAGLHDLGSDGATCIIHCGASAVAQGVDGVRDCNHALHGGRAPLRTLPPSGAANAASSPLRCTNAALS